MFFGCVKIGQQLFVLSDNCRFVNFTWRLNPDTQKIDRLNLIYWNIANYGQLQILDKWLEWLTVLQISRFLSDNYRNSCPKFANILSGISILEIMDLVPFISITRNKLHANNVQLFTSPAYDYLWPPTSYLNLLSRLVYFLAPFKEMKTLNCPTNTPFTLYLMNQTRNRRYFWWNHVSPDAEHGRISKK